MSQTATLMAKPAHQALPQLYVNDGPLRPQEVGTLLPTSLYTPIEEVRRRLREDGYVFVKNLLPREDVLKAREEYFRFISSSGILKEGTTPVQGIFNPEKERHNYPGIGAGAQLNGTEDTAKFMELALKAHTETWYKDVFCQHPVLLAYVAKLTGWGEDTLAVQRTLLRNNVPGNNAIGAHYDLIFLRHGDDSVLTAWAPMGDIKMDGGGLIYLEKGHELGAQIEREFTEKAMLDGMTEEEAKDAFNKNMMAGGALSDDVARFGRENGRKWLVTPYEAGDVVLHSSYAIHASTKNHDQEGVIRLGTDLRFVNSKAQWDTRWAKDYKIDDGL